MAVERIKVLDVPIRNCILRISLENGINETIYEFVDVINEKAAIGPEVMKQSPCEGLRNAIQIIVGACLSSDCYCAERLNTLASLCGQLNLIR